jgi:chromosome partitioning protein
MISPKITAKEVADFLNITVQGVHKKVKINELAESKIQNRTFYTHDTAKKLFNLKYKTTILTTSVVKGGVGKTTISDSLAIRATLYGLKVLCIDADQQANLTKGLCMGESAKTCPIIIDIAENKASANEALLQVLPGLDLIPSRLDNVTLDNYLMVNRINPAKFFHSIFGNIFKKYDLVIIDCPPTLGSTVCSAMLASDIVIAPLNPDIYSFEGIEIMHKEILNIYEQFDKKINLKILLNKFDSKTILSTQYLTELINDKKYSQILLKSIIRTSQDFPNCKNKGKSIFDSIKKSTAKEDIDQLTREIITEHMNKQGEE